MARGSGIQEPSGSDVRRFARNGVALALGGVASQVAFLFIEILIARRLGSEIYGVFATTYALVLFAVYLIDAGTAWWTVQEGSRDQDRLPELLGNSVTSELGIFTGLYIALLLALTVVPVPAEIRLFVAVFAFYGLVLAIQANLAAVFASQQRMHVTAMFQGSAPAVVLAVYFWLATGEAALGPIAIAYVVGAGGVTGLWFLWTAAAFKPRVSWAGIRAMLSQSYLYAMTGILGQVLYKADIVLLAMLAGAREAGIYAAAFKFLDLFYKVPILGGRVFAPALFKRSAEDWPGYTKLASGYARGQAVVGALASLATLLLAEELVLLTFGEDYAASVPVLRVLSAAMAVKCLIVASEGLLSSLGRHRTRVSLMAGAALLNIVLNLLLIPRFGGIGAAVGTVATGFLLVILYAAVGLKRLQSRRVLKWFLAPAIAGVLIAVAVISVSEILWLRLFLALAALPIVVVVTRYIRAREIAEILLNLWPRPTKP